MNEPGAVPKPSRSASSFSPSRTTLKGELIDYESYPTRAAAVASIGDYIDNFYNPLRRHSSIGYVSPIEFKLILLQSKRMSA